MVGDSEWETDRPVYARTYHQIFSVAYKEIWKQLNLNYFYWRATFFDHINIFLDIDGPIRANRFTDSRESLDSRESFQVPELNPFVANSASGG